VRKPKLKWNNKEGRWRFKLDGKSFAVSPRQLGCTVETKEASRSVAEQWRDGKLRASLEHRQTIAKLEHAKSDNGKALLADLAHVIRERDRCQQLGMIDRATKYGNVLGTIEARIAALASFPDSYILEQPEDSGATRLVCKAPDAATVARARLAAYLDSDLREHSHAYQLSDAQLNAVENKPRIVTLANAVDEFLADPERKKNGTEHEDNLRRELDRVLVSFGRDTDASTINGQSVLKLCKDVEEWGDTVGKLEHVRKMKTARWSARTRQLVLHAARQLLNWLWSSEILDSLPRNLDKLGGSDEPVDGEIIIWEPDELKTLFHASKDNELLHLACLLCLNFGAYQVDLASLLRSEVDSDAGRITKRRHKLRRRGGASVSYPLWATTLRLLRNQMASHNHPTLALVNENGNPLKHAEHKNGKFTKTDTISQRFGRLKENAALPAGKSLKNLRKTGSSWLANNPQYGENFALYYLQHKPDSVARESYIKPDPKRFDDAILAMGKAFGQ
jgi:integrase